MEEDQKKMIRQMLLKEPGWTILEKWLRNRIEMHAKNLIQENDEQVRGAIKELQVFFRRIDSIKQPKTK